MFITRVASSRDAWKIIQTEYPSILKEIESSLQRIDMDEMSMEYRKYVLPRPLHDKGNDGTKYETRAFISPRDLVLQIAKSLKDAGWKPNVRMFYPGRRQQRFTGIDHVKTPIGLQVSLSKTEFVESLLFVGFPSFIQAKYFEIAAILVPTQNLAKMLSPGVGSFEAIIDVLESMHPLPVKYPLLVLGFSIQERQLDVLKLTSDLDNYLLDILDMTLGQMTMLRERQSYEFKRSLPTNKKLAHELCAFANTQGGGVILLGISDTGGLVGVPKHGDLDKIQLTITNVIRDTCKPIPDFDLLPFDNPEDDESCILVIRIHEMIRKPCLAENTVYIRSGPSIRPASPEEIRKLVLG